MTSSLYAVWSWTGWNVTFNFPGVLLFSGLAKYYQLFGHQPISELAWCISCELRCYCQHIEASKGGWGSAFWGGMSAFWGVRGGWSAFWGGICLLRGVCLLRGSAYWGGSAFWGGGGGLPPPGRQRTREYGQCTGGTHPTGFLFGFASWECTVTACSYQAKACEISLIDSGYEEKKIHDVWGYETLF